MLEKRNDELIKFILQARRKGFLDSEIKAPLLKKGWPIETVDEAFSDIKAMQQRKTITISLDSKVYSILERRSKKHLFSLNEQIEDILRRSCVNTKTTKRQDKIDDLFIDIFSRRKYEKKNTFT